MTKSKTITAALAALTVAASVTAFSGQAQAKHWNHGWGFGAAVAAGTLIGIAAANSGPAYVEPGYSDCRYVARYDRWGNYVRTIKVCSFDPD